MIIAMYFCSAIFALMLKGLPDWLYWVLYIIQVICLITADISWRTMKVKVNSLEKALAERSEGK
jgi:hypothetical protein